jgi:hypothetical protein
MQLVFECVRNRSGREDDFDPSALREIDTGLRDDVAVSHSSRYDEVRCHGSTQIQ